MIDGEAVILGVEISDFNALHSGKQNHEVQLCAFDRLALDGEDLRKLRLSIRKTNLERLLRCRPDGIFVNPFETGATGPDLFRAACRMGLEGLVTAAIIATTVTAAITVAMATVVAIAATAIATTVTNDAITIAMATVVATAIATTVTNTAITVRMATVATIAATAAIPATAITSAIATVATTVITNTAVTTAAVVAAAAIARWRSMADDGTRRQKVSGFGLGRNGAGSEYESYRGHDRYPAEFQHHDTSPVIFIWR